MKKILLLVVTCIISLSGFGQEPELLDNDWFLHDLIIDGEHNIPYHTGYDFEIDFYEFEGEQFFYYGASSLNTVWIEYVTGEQKFEITQMVGLAKDVCWAGSEACISYQSKYQNFYATQLGNVLEYQIETGAGGTLTLTVTRPDGDQAIYRTVILATEDLAVAKFNIYPNPTSDVLFISSEEAVIETISIFNSRGQKVMTPDAMKPSIDVSVLQKGIYFIEIISEEGRSVQKFVKE